MNYDLSYPLWKYLEHKIDLSTFKNMVTSYLATTPKNVMENMFNLVGSHDTVRIKRRFKDDARRVKLSYLWMFLSSGAPNIYYGDEIGITGEHDPDNRRCMLWNQEDQDLDFKMFTQSIIKLRKEHPSFSDYDYHFIDADILIFSKKKENDHILVMMNNGQQIEINVSNEIAGDYINLLTSEKVRLHDKINIEAYGFLLLQKEF